MRYLITGGTGSLGQEIVTELLKKENTETINIFSRDEFKQKNMKANFNHPKLKFIIGDIRDSDASMKAMIGVDVVFHLAALKHVDILEENPIESIRTNIDGTINMANLAMNSPTVKKFAFSSTDKAVDPYNVYGMSKGIGEKVLLDMNKYDLCKYYIFRWGNVFASRGSFIETLNQKVKLNLPIEVTDPKMTRFWISLNNAAKFMIESLKEEDCKKIFIPNLTSCSLERLIEAFGIFYKRKLITKIVGPREGEKFHELLRSVCDPDFLTSKKNNMDTREILEMIRAEV